MPTRHPQWYLPHGDLVVQIGETLFRLDSSVLARRCDGGPFLPKSEIPREVGSPADGTDDDHPLVLKDETAEDFETLVFALFASPLELVSKPVKPKDYLLTMVRLAHKWSFPSVAGYAIALLMEHRANEVSPADKLCTVVLYGATKDPEWVALAHMEVAETLSTVLKDPRLEAYFTIDVFARYHLVSQKLLSRRAYASQPSWKHSCSMSSAFTRAHSTWQKDPNQTRPLHAIILNEIDAHSYRCSTCCLSITDSIAECIGHPKDIAIVKEHFPPE